MGTGLLHSLCCAMEIERTDRDTRFLNYTHVRVELLSPFSHSLDRHVPPCSCLNDSVTLLYFNRIDSVREK